MGNLRIPRLVFTNHGNSWGALLACWLWRFCSTHVCCNYRRTIMTSKTGKYEYFQGEDNLWYFNRVAGNGEVEHPSEGYVSKGGAIAAIGRLMDDSSHYDIVERPNQKVPMTIET